MTSSKTNDKNRGQILGDQDLKNPFLGNAITLFIFPSSLSYLERLLIRSETLISEHSHTTLSCSTLSGGGDISDQKATHHKFGLSFQSGPLV